MNFLDNPRINVSVFFDGCTSFSAREDKVLPNRDFCVGNACKNTPASINSSKSRESTCSLYFVANVVTVDLIQVAQKHL